ncbi:RNA polymerase sigma-I factor [Dehalobacterium formicoaceticum]|uniref:RNA polymerase sigma-I factor n=1 Tax=Dehalobacterium formicoaceticum TaxID=51515 RepID=UPI0012FC937E|nr:RNA polymerase sigma-I factor [Dehalobacterium formicoaceticum]
MDDLDTLLKSAQSGHRDAREQLIKRFRPLVIKTASSLCGRYIDADQDDEVSIGMLAVDQAIDTYKTEGGTSFFNYAEIVIKRRLIDHYRREQRLSRAIPFSSFGGDQQAENDGILNQIEHHQAMMEFQKKQESSDRREEIKQYTKLLNNYGISFSDLVSCAPKHEDARLRAMEAARLIAEQEELRTHLELKKELPLKQMAGLVKVSRKTLERQRKYIIAMTLIICGDFKFLQDYLKKSS